VNRTLLAIDLLERVSATAAGSTVTVAAATSEDVDFIDAWCRASGNAVLAVLPDSVEVYRGSLADPTAVLPAERLPGYRLWMYTNFHCNLACDYCCVSSKTYIAPLGAFYQNVVLPNWGFFGALLTVAELAIGLGLLLGVAARLAAVVGLLLIGPIWLMLLHTGLYLWQYPADLFPLGPARDRPGRSGRRSRPATGPPVQTPLAVLTAG